MITNIDKKVVCVKDIPSNIIEEAIFILKNDIATTKKESLKIKRKDIIDQETRDFLKEYIPKIENDRRGYKKNSQLQKMTEFVFLMVLSIFACFLVIYMIF